jgi:eukaryotic-like serine/threonine-protein kinase
MSLAPTFRIPPMSVELERPRSLFGYDIVDFVGEGAGSVIYAVTDPVSMQLFALKHVVRKTEKDIRFVEQLENEYNVGKNLAHPNLRRVIDFKCNRTILRKVIDAALVMELFDGHPLETQVPRDLIVLLDCFIATASGLTCMHQAGYVHCDLKPNNILLGADGEVKVIDLGQACPVGTVKARIQGTPDFISPEQVKCQPVSKATDVFNFGATLYWALTGKKVPTLFTIKKGENSFLLDNAIAAPHELNPMIPIPLSNFTMECVRTVATKRPADMTDVVRRLEIMRHSIARDRGVAQSKTVYTN